MRNKGRRLNQRRQPLKTPCITQGFRNTNGGALLLFYFSFDILSYFISHRYDLSVAIFAPGWVYEVLGSKDFPANNEKFWNQLLPFLQSRSTHFPNGIQKQFRSTNSTHGQELCYKLNSHAHENEMPCIVPSVENTITIWAPQHFHAMVLTDSGELEVSTGHTCTATKGFEDRSFSITNVTDNMVKISSSSDFSIHSIKWNANNQLSRLRIKGGDFTGVSPSKRSILLYKDIHWKSAGDEKFFLLSCTLVMDHPPDCHYTTVAYILTPTDRIKNSPHSNAPNPVGSGLGRSFCPFFRVKELKVPNPKYHGECCVTFICRHFHLLGDCSQELTLQYEENLRL